MAGVGKGRPRKAGASRPDQRKAVKVLVDRSEAAVPPLPEPEEWLSNSHEDGPGREWSQPVRDWWGSIWTSPMSGEFVHSDIHGLYVAALYLEESVNPFNKATDRLKFGQAWEKAIQSYGLTPTARESLRWAIAQGEQADNRTTAIRQQRSLQEKAKSKDGDNTVVDLYDRFG